MEKVVTTRRAKDKLTFKQIQHWLRSAGRRAGQKLADGGGLYLTSMPSGRASWQVRYAYAGKPATFSIGSVDDVSLAHGQQNR